MSHRKLILATLVLVAAGLVWVFDIHHLLQFESLKARQAGLQAAVQAQPLVYAAGFFSLYVVATALSIPGAVVLTLAGGALFGLLWGTLLVSFASSIGATLAFAVARHVLREPVAARFGSRLAEVDKGVERDGAFYLFTLRLVPVVPFFVINLLMGLTRMRARTFYWVSQLGMFPATVVYINAGTQLADLQSPAGILSPAMLGSFVLLALFPWLARSAVSRFREHRAYGPWAASRPARYDRNLVVIGAGAAGLVTAYIAAAVKARVTLVEAHRMGGDCLNYGCVPSKALIRSARLAHQMRHADRWGLNPGQPAVSFKAVMQRVQNVVKSIEPHDSVERYTRLGVDVVQGHATLVNPWTVDVRKPDGSLQRLTTRSIVIATGAAPVVPDLPGLREVALTSDTLWEALSAREAPPRRLVVLGGGPIGCELAQAMARLGSQVIQIEQAERLLGREDPDVSDAVRQALQDDGVQVLTGHQALRCETVPETAARVLVATGVNGEVRIEFDELLCAVGRAPRLSGYGLEALGIPTQRTVQTNEYLQTLYPNILAAGDVAGPYQFTHTAAHQAWYAAVNALFGRWKRFRVDYRVIPAATFVDPEVARVGLNETEARAQGVPCEVTRYGIDDLDRALADGEAHGFVKVLTEPGRDRILGVTIVGSHAAELLAEYVLAMKQGIGLNRILGTIHTYPTWSEANKYAAGEWKRAHAPATLLRWVERYHTWERG